MWLTLAEEGHSGNIHPRKQFRGRGTKEGIILPQIFAALAANIVNVVINYILLFVLHLGVQGSALANTISQISLSVFLFLYIRIRKLHALTWGGWSWECLQEWGPFTSLAVPSMLILCFEWWIYEIGNFVAGLISVTELGAESVMYQICTVAYMLPYGLSIAASVRVGNALGAGNEKQAKSSAVVALYCTGMYNEKCSKCHTLFRLLPLEKQALVNATRLA
ncbi:hypothetical protein NDU88_002657 [Pleurodeles waltl]|uniref:Multidrug and toxin extrusion protein 1 n=1 Tax=Pleurodeles waltl TaxID=8319 RepID=A0AAV7UBG9_PLEWA|nr:hypothetical protein NDU88_002657 [Pleurodeles waltl]